MGMSRGYDIHEVAKEFMGKDRADRRDLIELFKRAFNHDKAVQTLVAQVGQSCINAGSAPIQVVAIGMMYGMVLGIRMEQERANRKLVREN